MSPNPEDIRVAARLTESRGLRNLLRQVARALEIACEDVRALARQRDAMVAHIRDQHAVLKRTAERLLEAERENNALWRMVEERDLELEGRGPSIH